MKARLALFAVSLMSALAVQAQDAQAPPEPTPAAVQVQADDPICEHCGRPLSQHLALPVGTPLPVGATLFKSESSSSTVWETPAVPGTQKRTVIVEVPAVQPAPVQSVQTQTSTSTYQSNGRVSRRVLRHQRAAARAALR